MKIELRPIGHVRGGRTEPVDDDWAAVTAAIELDRTWLGTEALLGLDEFSHADVLFHFHRRQGIETGARHPRDNPAWPRVGIFAQRGSGRPNLLGASTCRIVAVEGARLQVQGLDAIDGTPVLDIKPHMSGFAPRGPFREPDWAREILAGYW